MVIRGCWDLDGVADELCALSFLSSAVPSSAATREPAGDGGGGVVSCGERLARGWAAWSHASAIGYSFVLATGGNSYSHWRCKRRRPLSRHCYEERVLKRKPDSEIVEQVKTLGFLVKEDRAEGFLVMGRRWGEGRKRTFNLKF